MFQSKLLISNIKASFKLKSTVLALQHFCQKVKPKKKNGSFFVHRHKTFVYCIYYKGHVNVTGIKRKHDLIIALSYLKQIPHVCHVKLLSIDNITCSAKLNSGIYTWSEKFSSYLKRLNKLCNGLYTIQYSPQIFPGAFLKTKLLGTIVFFATGKFNIVGCKSFASVFKSLITFTQLLEKLNIK